MRPGWIELAVGSLFVIGCGIDDSLQAGADGGPGNHADASGDVVVADVAVGDGAGSGGDSTSGGDGGLDTGSESGFPDAAPVCDAGSTLGGSCSGAGGCCLPLQCTTAMTCQWTCTQNGSCTSDSNCCPGSYCGPGGTCTCVAVGGACTSDTQCCSVIAGGGCDHQNDSGVRTCGNN